jgi:hypothetical protein
MTKIGRTISKLWPTVAFCAALLVVGAITINAVRPAAIVKLERHE